MLKLKLLPFLRQTLRTPVVPSPPDVSTSPPTPPIPAVPDVSLTTNQAPFPTARAPPPNRHASVPPVLRRRTRKSTSTRTKAKASRPSLPSKSSQSQPDNSTPNPALPTTYSRQSSILNFLATQPSQEPDHTPPPPPEPPPPRNNTNLLDYFRKSRRSSEK